jgi:hypothetical protein
VVEGGGVCRGDSEECEWEDFEESVEGYGEEWEEGGRGQGGGCGEGEAVGRLEDR